MRAYVERNNGVGKFDKFKKQMSTTNEASKENLKGQRDEEDKRVGGCTLDECVDEIRGVWV